MLKISFDEFVEKYKPVTNHLDNNAAFDGTMFETFGAEVQHVVEISNVNPTRVWTFLSGDGDFIVNGYHLLNRVGYFLTEVCAEEDIEIALNDSKEYGILPEEHELFVEFAKETTEKNYVQNAKINDADVDEKNDAAETDLLYAENVNDALADYKVDKNEFERLFRVVREQVDEFSHFDTDWDNFKKRLV